jgi:hypothetical protein
MDGQSDRQTDRQTDKSPHPYKGGRNFLMPVFDTFSLHYVRLAHSVREGKISKLLLQLSREFLLSLKIKILKKRCHYHLFNRRVSCWKNRWSAFSLKHLFIKAAFYGMACSSNAQVHLIFKTVSRISVALLHPKLLLIK